LHIVNHLQEKRIQKEAADLRMAIIAKVANRLDRLVAALRSSATNKNNYKFGM